MKKTIIKILNEVDRSTLTNTQKALIRLLKAEGEWVARTSMQIPSVTSRLRDLRKENYGGFAVQYSPAQKLGRPRASRSHHNNIVTYYRLDLRHTRIAQIQKILGIG